MPFTLTIKRLPGEAPRGDVLLLLAVFVGCWCASPAPAQQWFSYSAADGLAANPVSDIGQTADGVLWLATSGGVSRFDGTWRNFTTADGLADDQVNAVLAAVDGTVWVGTSGGASRYGGVSWQTFTESDGLAGDRVTALLQAADGSVWFGTRTGVSRYDGVGWQSFTKSDGLADDRVFDMAQAADGSVWFGTFGGVSRFDGTGWRTFTTVDGLADDRVNAVLAASDGSVWFGTFGAGANRYDGTSWQTFTTGDGLADNVVNAIVELAEGVLWFGTSGGASRYDGTNWQTFTMTDGLGDNTVQAFYQSLDGSVWLGTVGGISRYEGPIWHTFTVENTGRGLPYHEVTAIYEATDGALWVGTTFGGVARFDGTAWQTFTTEDGLAGNWINDIHQSRDGAMWFATGNGSTGISRYDGNTWQVFGSRDGLAQNWTMSIVEDRAGNIWVGTKGRGVSRYDGTAWQTFTTEDGLGADQLNDGAVFQASDGSVWFGTIGGGASRYDGMVWETFTVENTGGGLADNRVKAVYESADGAMWFGTLEGGVSRYDGTHWQTFTVENTQRGLGHDSVSDIVQAQDGALWFSTWEGGISRFDRGWWENFTEEDGLGNNKVVKAIETRDGILWFTHLGGVTRFRRPVQALVQTVLERTPPARLGSDRFFFQARGFEVGSPRQPPLSFALTPAGTAPREDDWSAYEQGPGFEVTGMADGEWTFHLRALDRYGNVDPTPVAASFTVDVVPPTVLITAPLGVVHGAVEVVGSAFDNSLRPDLHHYVLEYGPAQPGEDLQAIQWQRILDPATEPVVDGVLGIWDTQGLHGRYILRLTATDQLNHVSQYAVQVDLVAAQATVDPQQGGHIAADGGALDLYLPPGSLAQATAVTIAPVDAAELSAPVDPQVRLLGPAFDLEPADLALAKPAVLRLAIEVEDLGPLDEGEHLALYAWSGADWSRLGGTFDGGAGLLTTPLGRLGRLALMADASAGAGARTLSNLSCQPRVFYPRGGGFDVQTTISFELGQAAPVTVKVYDLEGRLLRRVSQGQSMNAGRNAVAWDGRDDDGRLVADDLYIVAVEAAGHTRTQTVSVLH
ncbi:MAG: hypothetical protein GKR89_30555 [Candidatus Latescibacteria bacterium]|nr:hypothetical protein [Candidatus Latescibacterota bacterium]